MKPIKLILLAACLGASCVAMAAEAPSDAARDQRMGEALEKYHDSRDTNPGPAARAEESMKRGAAKTGNAIKQGTRKVVHAVKHGAQEASEAVHHMDEKIQGKSKSDQ